MIRIFTSKTQSFGEKGEQEAVSCLKKAGYRIVGRNVANKFGEIDIVARKGQTYYFFEVKAGKRGGVINPVENLTQSKIRKFLISVEHYALVHSIKDYRVQGIIVLESMDDTFTVEVLDLL